MSQARECRIFGQKFFEDLIQFFLVRMGFRFHRHGHDRFEQFDVLENHRVLLVTERFPGGGVLHPHHTDDLSGIGLIHPLPFVGVHAENSGNLLFLFPGRIEDIRPGREPPAVNSGKG